MSELLFVYGTLRSDAGHPMRNVLASAGSRLGAGTVEGTLVRVDWYPGLIPTPGAGPVHGELWSVHDSAAWPQLDAYEGCASSDEPPHEYVRQHIPARPTGGQPTMAWAYVYRGPTEGLDVIAGGDWLRRNNGVLR